MDEEIKKIADDLRARADRAEAAVGFPTVEAENDRRLADRLDAAAKREATAGKSLAVGNAAVMREALLRCEAISHLPEIRERQCVKDMRNTIILALSAPARNCDVCGTGPEAVGAYRRRLPPHYLRKAREYDDIEDFAAWLYAKAEGGAK